MPILLDDKEVRNNLTIINRICRSIYDQYIVNSNFVYPRDIQFIKEGYVFAYSFFVIRNGYFDFLNGHIVIPEVMTKALNDKGFYGELKKDGWYLEGKTNKYQVSIPCDGNVNLARDISKTGVYANMVSDAVESNFTHIGELDEETAKRLLNYEAILVPMVDDKGHTVKIYLTMKMLPALKHANSIKFLARRFESVKDEVYEVVVVSNSADWTFYSKHYILNM